MKQQTVPLCYYYFSLLHSNLRGTLKLPVLDDAHHWSSHTHIDGLSHLRQEVLLNLKAPLPNAPASIHQEGQVHLTVCRTRQNVTADSLLFLVGHQLKPYCVEFDSVPLYQRATVVAKKSMWLTLTFGVET